MTGFLDSYCYLCEKRLAFGFVSFFFFSFISSTSSAVTGSRAGGAELSERYYFLQREN